MAQLGINRGRQAVFELLDPFRDGLQAGGVAIWIAPAFVVGDDGEAVAEGSGEIG